MGFADGKIRGSVLDGALTEARIVGVSCEGARYVGVLAAIADAPEQLIALRKVVVLANIKVVGVIGLAAVDGIVAGEGSGNRSRWVELQQLDRVRVQTSSG